MGRDGEQHQKIKDLVKMIQGMRREGDVSQNCGRDGDGGGKFDERYGERLAFFWGKGFPFSQCRPSKFAGSEVTCGCVEQFVMHQGALCFQGERRARYVVMTGGPMKQTKLGRTIRNYDKRRWYNICGDTVKKGTMRSFDTIRI